MNGLVHECIIAAAQRRPDDEALVYENSGSRRTERLSYAQLACRVRLAANVFLHQGLQRGQRVAVYLEKRPETVLSMFGASCAGGVFVPVNPLLKAEQVRHILIDCSVTILVTSAERLALLQPVLKQCIDLRAIYVVGAASESDIGPASGLPGLQILSWEQACESTSPIAAHRVIDADMAAILYTSGSTGKPKGVVLSHRNLVAGAVSVARYLENDRHDRILAVLPLSFDYGLNQLTTAFHVGAAVVLLNHLLPRDILNFVQREGITGLAGVPPLWRQLASLPWATDCTLRYLTNSGGSMPGSTLQLLRKALPKARPYLMYGLTEAFRSTYLPPEELALRPGSIGKAVPNAEILVLRPDGTPCAAEEPGELVHRGALVALGYWNDPAKTAERFRPLPTLQNALPFPEIAVWSGDTVRTDAEGFLYFISRDDEMIKSSGYRISPSEVEEVLYGHADVAEAVAVGVAHPTLGQAIVVVASMHPNSGLDAAALLMACKTKLPGYMVPARIVVVEESLPRNPNGKIDRNLLRRQWQDIFSEPTA
ncbi:MAG: acyl-CoA ligase (AMP-forming), exosortase A system-associated [Pseudomonadota bacterium]